MAFNIVEPNGSITIPSGNLGSLVTDHVKIKLNTESLTTLLRSNISCHMNKTLNQELMEELTAQIIESIDYFINKSDETI
jgi:hypothetical protein